MALAVSWKGYADVESVSFVDFFYSDHTIAARFMPQYPHAYDGPIVTNSGGGLFFMGQGDFLFGSEQTKLVVRVGDQTVYYEATLLPAAWYHIALVRQVDTYTFYINGVAHPITLIVPSSNQLFPTGTLRFGRQESMAGTRQFYGFIDDVTIFDAALAENQVRALAETPHLTGNEANLKYGWTFGGTPLPTSISLPISLHGAARLQPVSEDRIAPLDYQQLPMPSEHQKMLLPFKPNEAWSVIQGFDQPHNTHKGFGSFGWDFVLADRPQQSEYPNGSGGAPFYASAGGKVVDIKQDYVSSDSSPNNSLQVEQAVNEICIYLHLRTKSAAVQVGDTVKQGQLLALTGDVGARIGANHIHLMVCDKLDLTAGYVTFPIAFSNYEVRQTDGTWQPVALGIPKLGETIRLPRPEVNPPIDVDPFPRWWLWPIIVVRWVMRAVVVIVRTVILVAQRIFNWARRG